MATRSSYSLPLTKCDSNTNRISNSYTFSFHIQYDKRHTLSFRYPISHIFCICLTVSVFINNTVTLCVAFSICNTNSDSINYTVALCVSFSICLSDSVSINYTVAICVTHSISNT